MIVQQTIHVTETGRDIEAAAERLWARCSQQLGWPLTAPVPVEEILEFGCGLRLHFVNMATRLGRFDVLGGTWVATREVMVDQSLDPIEHPDMEGRYRFTLAHELGHWELHREGQPEDEALCRDDRPGRPPLEREADHFAGCLLMPRVLVEAAWRERYGSLRPWRFEGGPAPHRDPAVTPAKRAGGTIERRRRWPSDIEEVLDHKARDFAPMFLVSVQAMRIRLEELGLLQRGGV